jgi:hypothetical protein
MSKHVLHIILESCDLALRPYTGRGMRHECLAVTTDTGTGELFAAVLDGINWQRDDDLGDIAEAFRGMRTDSMGKSTIYYFPTVDYCVEAKEDGDSDDRDPADPIHPLYPA